MFTSNARHLAHSWKALLFAGLRSKVHPGEIAATRASASAGRSLRIAATGVCTLLLLGVSAPAHAQNVSFAGVQTTVGSGLSAPRGVAVDAAGDLFIADTGNNRVMKVPVGGGTPTTIGSGLNAPYGVAVDAAGNVFIAEPGLNQVVEVPAGGGSQTTVGTGLNSPYGVAVDTAGNVFIAEPGLNQVVEVPTGGGAQTTVPASGLNFPAGVAVDAAGDVFIGDTANNRIVKVPAGGGAQTSIGTGLTSPIGMSVDASGNLFIADFGNNRVVEVPGGGGTQITVGAAVNQPYGVVVDGAGDLFIADTGNNRAVELQRISVNFGNINICPGGQTTPAPCSQTLALNYTVNVSTTFASTPTVVTQGAPNLDFTLSSTTCTGTLTAGNSCTVNVSLAPLAPGVRMGAVQLKDSLNNLLATTLVHGLSRGPAIAFGPGTPTTVGSGLSSPQGVALDGAGDVFIADTGLGQVIEIPAGGGAQTTVGSGLSNPLDVAVDGAGNVFIADTSNNRVIEVPAGGGPQTTVGTGLSLPSGVTVDGSGNVFIADSGNNRVVEVRAGGGPQTTVGSGLSFPSGVTVDGAGNIFIADSSNNRVVEVPAGGGAQTTVGSGLIYPSQVAVDAAGNVFIADTHNNRVAEVPAGGGAQTTVGSGLSFPDGVAVDGTGDIFIADSANKRVVKIQRSILPTFSFASTIVFTTSADSPQSLTMQNIGNQLLSAIAPGLSIGVNSFEQVAGSGTPADCTTSFSLAPGASCNLSVSFVPQTTGGIASAATFTDNALNATTATQSVTLTGTGQPAPTPLIQTISFTTAAPASASYNSTFPVGAQSTSGLTVVLSVDAVSTTVCSLGTQSVAVGVTSATVTMLSGTGTCTIDANQAGNGTYSAAVQQQTSATSAKIDAFTYVTSTPNASNYGQSVTLSATVLPVAPGTGTPSGGTITFMNGATTLGTGTPLSLSSLPGTSGGWSQITTSGTSPLTICSVPVLGDGLGDLIFYGSLPSSNCSGATSYLWVLSHANGLGGTPTWTQLFPTGGPPPARHAGMAVYDPTTNSMIIYGGCEGGCNPVGGDVWVLSHANGQGGTPAWTQLSPSGGPPSLRINAAATYDPASNRIMIFAGQNGGGSACGTYSDSWVLTNANGTGGTPTWIQLSPTGGPPAGQYGPSSFYDSVHNRMVVAGGSGIIGGVCSLSNAVWVLSNANGIGGTPVWTNLLPEGAPGAPPNFGGLMPAIYDSANNRGLLQYPTAASNNVWGIVNANGLGGPAAWVNLNPSNGPAAAGVYGIVYDSTNKLLSSLHADNSVWVMSTGVDSITATYSGDSNFNATGADAGSTATPLPQTVNQVGQTISFVTLAPASAGYNSTFPVAAQSTSGLTVVLSVDASSTSICSLGTSSVVAGITSATVTMLSAVGTCTIDANQAGNSDYSAAIQQQTSATATIASQTISFSTSAPPSAAYNSTFPVAAQSTSGLTVTLTVDVLSTSVCALGTSSVSGGVTSATVTMLSGTGMCTIDANQAGNVDYTAATQQQTSAAAALASQAALTVTGPASVTYGTTGTATATGGSGTGAVTFSAGGSTGCTVTGTTVSVSNAGGTCTLTATKAADIDYAAVTSVPFSVTLVQASAVIVVTPYNVPYDGAPHTATGSVTGVGGINLSSGLTLTGTTHTNAGSYPADPWSFTDASGNYKNASGTVSDNIGKASATLTLSNLSQTYNGSAKPVTVTTSPAGLSGVSVTYTGTGGTVYGPNTTAPTNAGSYLVDASLTNANYQASDATGTLTIVLPTLVSITVTPVNPTILVGATQPFVATGTYSDNSTQTITSSVTWASATTSVAAIGASTGVATGVKTGTSQITATLGSVTSPSDTITVNNPAPSINSLTPTHAPAGAAFTLTVNGSGFVSTSAVGFSGKTETTTFVSATQLTAAIPASDMSSGGVVNATVNNPAPGGGASAAGSFTIDSFSVAGPLSTTYVVPGTPTPVTILITPTSNGFADSVQLVASGLPKGMTALFSQDPLTPGTTATKVILTLTATAAAALQPVPSSKHFPSGPVGLLATILAAGMLIMLRRGPWGVLLPSRAALVLWIIVIGGLGISLSGCAGGFQLNSNATPAGNYTITVTGTSGTAQQSGTFTISVE